MTDFKVQVTLCDSKGSEVFCKCGNPATGGCMGKSAYMVWCASCDPNNEFYKSLPKMEIGGTARFITSGKFDPILSPEWQVNLREDDAQSDPS